MINLKNRLRQGLLGLIAKIGKSGNNFFLKKEYVSRTEISYFEDSLVDTQKIIHQPDVYPLAAFLGRKFGCSHIIDIGCGRARKLVELHPEFHITGIDYGSNIKFCRDNYPFGQWIELNLEHGKSVKLKREVIRHAVVICSDVIEHLKNPINLLKLIEDLLRDAPLAVLTTPERDLARGNDDTGPPVNPYHMREWNLPEFQKLVEAAGLNIRFGGLTVNNNTAFEKKTSLIVCERLEQIKPVNDFRVVAFMTAFNEEDIIEPSISYLASQGIEVYLIENWSTDTTYERAKNMLGKGLIGIERFPAEGPSQYYEWVRLLTRVETLANEISADWFIHHDVDEIREGPTPGIRLKDSIWQVDQSGFNAIDHTVIFFHPVDNNFIPGSDFKKHFSFFEFGRRPGHFQQIKAWKNLKKRISLAETGGHEVKFEGRRVYPYKFLLRHYPVRSQAHGEKKVFLERKQRYSPEEKKGRGWHGHYDSINGGCSFLKKPEDLIWFDDTFYKTYLVERLTGIGILRQ